MASPPPASARRSRAARATAARSLESLPALPALPSRRGLAGSSPAGLPLRDVSAYGRETSLLGSGSFGDVRVVCQQPCVSEDDKVALKTSRQLDGALDAGLLKEAAALARLTHPNVVRLLDVAVIDGTFALVLPVAVASLHAYVGRLPPRDVGVIAYQLARALAYLEGVGVLHRDIKPGNVLLYRESCTAQGVEGSPARPMAVLADFGLSLVGTCAHPDDQLSSEGTLSYIAPEVLLGGRFTAAADLWALGCTLYEALTGSVAFPGEDETAVLLSVFHTFSAPSPISWLELRSYPGWRAEYDVQRPTAAARLRAVDATTLELLLGSWTLDPSARPSAGAFAEQRALLPFRQAVERCSPVDTGGPLDCASETQLAQALPQRPPAWATERRRHVVAEWLEELRDRASSSLRGLFLAQQLVDRYAQEREPLALSVVPLLCQVASHVACALVERRGVLAATFADADTSQADFRRLELDVLRALRFDVLRSTPYDVLKSMSIGFYSRETVDAAVSLLRMAAHTTLCYEAYPDELACACLLLACSATREQFKHEDRVPRERYRQLIPRLFGESARVLASAASSARLATPFGSLQQLIERISIANEYVAAAGLRARLTARDVARQLADGDEEDEGSAD